MFETSGNKTRSPEVGSIPVVKSTKKHPKFWRRHLTRLNSPQTRVSCVFKRDTRRVTSVFTKYLSSCERTFKKKKKKEIREKEEKNRVHPSRSQGKRHGDSYALRRFFFLFRPLTREPGRKLAARTILSSLFELSARTEVSWLPLPQDRREPPLFFFFFFVPEAKGVRERSKSAGFWSFYPTGRFSRERKTFASLDYPS